MSHTFFMSPKIYFYVYVSSAVQHMSNQELRDLQNVAHARNAKVGVSGMLLYKDGNFMQVVEGPELVVQSLIAKIFSDPRHIGFFKLFDGYTDQRQFEGWSMGFRDLNNSESKSAPGYSEFLNTSLTGSEFKHDPTACQRLLLSFKKTHP